MVEQYAAVVSSTALLPIPRMLLLAVLAAPVSLLVELAMTLTSGGQWPRLRRWEMRWCQSCD
uniref:Uncharacterized protein n=1 Tax=Oryza punctata TaxID=4537 RepID=A0A0E0LTU0_ORYPU